MEQEPNHAVLNNETYENLKSELALISTEILKAPLCEDSKEVAVYIAGYVCKQLNNKIKCEDYMIMLASETSIAAKPSLKYSQCLYHGSFSISSSEIIKHYISNGFAILELVEHILLNKFSYISIRAACLRFASFWLKHCFFMPGSS